MVSITEQKYQIEKAKAILDGNRILYTEIDCSNEENRVIRDRYFDVSGVRGNYPQLFLQNGDGEENLEIKYLGSYSELEVGHNGAWMSLTAILRSN